MQVGVPFLQLVNDYSVRHACSGHMIRLVTGWLTPKGLCLRHPTTKRRLVSPRGERDRVRTARNMGPGAVARDQTRDPVQSAVVTPKHYYVRVTQTQTQTQTVFERTGKGAKTKRLPLVSPTFLSPPLCDHVSGSMTIGPLRRRSRPFDRP